MDQSQIRAVFHRTFNGQMNFLTPDHVKSGKRGRMLYEISSGEGFRNSPLYGVTVLELDGTRRPDLSGSFSSLAEARAFVSADFSTPEPIDHDHAAHS